MTNTSYLELFHKVERKKKLNSIDLNDGQVEISYCICGFIFGTFFGIIIGIILLKIIGSICNANTTICITIAAWSE